MTDRKMIKQFMYATCLGITLLGTANAEEILFRDTFNRPGSEDLNQLAIGKRGTLKSKEWREHNENADQSLSFIKANRLVLSQNDRTSAASIQHNFTDESILAKGGFIVEFDLAEFVDQQSDSAGVGEDFELSNKYCGFGVGLSLAEVKSWRHFKLNHSFRGIKAGQGSCDFWIGVANYISPELQIRKNGLTLEALSIPSCKGKLRATFKLVRGFTEDGQVEVHLTLDGKAIDIDTSRPDRDYRIFQWENENQNYIALEARTSGGAHIDDFKISLPDRPLKATTLAKKIKPKAGKTVLATGLFVFSPILLLLFRRIEEE